MQSNSFAVPVNPVPVERLGLVARSRVELPVVVPAAVEAPAPVKPKAKRVSKPKAEKPTAAISHAVEPIPNPAPTPVPVAVFDPTVTRWATFGVGFTLLLSAALNGYANAQHAPLAFAGWLMGLAVPVLVLVLSKVAGEKFRHGHRGVAWFAGLSGVALLFLSVWHCSQSIALLTGSPVALAMPMAGDRRGPRGVRAGTHHRAALLKHG